jgi:hypothetical protein
MLSIDPIEPATEYPTVLPIEPEPPYAGLSPARMSFNARLLLHGALHALRLSVRHNARAYVGNGKASASYVAGELRLGAMAARQARQRLLDALELLRTEMPPHPGTRPGCPDLLARGKPDGVVA